MELEEGAGAQGQGRERLPQGQPRAPCRHHGDGAQARGAPAHGQGRAPPALEQGVDPAQALLGQPDAGAEPLHQGVSRPPAGEEQRRGAQHGDGLQGQDRGPQREGARRGPLAHQQHHQVGGDGDGDPRLHGQEEDQGGGRAQPVEGGVAGGEEVGARHRGRECLMRPEAAPGVWCSFGLLLGKGAPCPTSPATWGC